MVGRRVWTLLVALVLPACTQVLGLEQAELEAPASGRGASATAGRGGSTAPAVDGPTRGIPPTHLACQAAPLEDCAKCLSTEPDCSYFSTCLRDGSCRTELDSYTRCLGGKCDGDPEQCYIEVGDPKLAGCITTCATECGKAPLTSSCELYCACMESTCKSELPFLPGWDCMAECEKLPDYLVQCRRHHCEYAKGGDLTHCRHASDREHVCKDNEELPPADRAAGIPCGALQESTWACTTNAECCSKKCRSGTCD